MVEMKIKATNLTNLERTESYKIELQLTIEIELAVVGDHIPTLNLDFKW